MAIGAGANRGTNVAGAGNNQSIAVTVAGGSITAPSVAIIFVAKTGTTALTSVVDTQGNPWTFLGAYTNATSGGIRVEAWLGQINTTLTTSDSVTATWGVNESDICAALRAWTIGSGNTLALTTGTTNPITSEVNGANDFGSSAFSGLASVSRLWLRVAGKQANSTSTITASTNFTSWALNIRSRNNSNASIARAEERINTSTGETSNPTLAVSGNTAGLFFALQEVASGPTAKASSETVSIALTETAVPTIGSQAPDTLSVSLSETAVPTIGSQAPDTLNISVSEAARVVNVLNASDSISIELTDPFRIRQITPDSVVISVTDNATILAMMQNVADTLNISLSEVASVANALRASDSLSVAVSEATSILNSVTASDTLPVDVQDQVARLFVTLAISDTFGITLSDAAYVLVLLAPVLDTLNISITEAVSILELAIQQFTASDTVAIGVSEAVTLLVSALTADAISLDVQDAVGTVQATLQVADTLSLTLTEASSVLVFLQGVSDSLGITLTEATVLLQSLAVSAADTLSISVSEATSLAITTMLVASDDVAIALAEDPHISVTLSAAETVSVVADEAVALLAQASTEDTVSLDVLETGAAAVLLTAIDTVTTTMFEVADIQIAAFLVRHGDVLTATVTRMTPVRSVIPRSVKTVESLTPFYTVGAA